MIVSLRGTSGSGKTTVVRDIMKRFPDEAVVKLPGEGKRPRGYKLGGAIYPAIYVVGSYESVCGGCDTIETQDEVCNRVREYAALGGHVLFEGLLLSNIYARYAALARELNPINKFVFGFLDTPLELCLERVNERRRARGKMDPVDPKNTTAKHEQVMWCAKKTMDEPDLDSRWVDHTRASEQVWGWLLEG